MGSALVHIQRERARRRPCRVGDRACVARRAQAFACGSARTRSATTSFLAAGRQPYFRAAFSDHDCARSRQSASGLGGLHRTADAAMATVRFRCSGSRLDRNGRSVPVERCVSAHARPFGCRTERRHSGRVACRSLGERRAVLTATSGPATGGTGDQRVPCGAWSVRTERAKRTSPLCKRSVTAHAGGGVFRACGSARWLRLACVAGERMSNAGARRIAGAKVSRWRAGVSTLVRLTCASSGHDRSGREGDWRGRARGALRCLDSVTAPRCFRDTSACTVA